MTTVLNSLFRAVLFVLLVVEIHLLLRLLLLFIGVIKFNCHEVVNLLLAQLHSLQVFDLLELSVGVLVVLECLHAAIIEVQRQVL